MSKKEEILSYLKTGFILFAICAVCAALCGLVNMVTAPRIEENSRKANEAALRKVSGGMLPGDAVRSTDLSDFDEERFGAAINEVTPLYTDDARTQLGGYSLQLNCTGYGGPITVIASYKKNGELIGAQMTTNSETAGLGKKYEEAKNMSIFLNKGGEGTALPLTKNDLTNDEQAIVSGATVTFNGLATALNLGSQWVKEQK